MIYLIINLFAILISMQRNLLYGNITYVLNDPQYRLIISLYLILTSFYLSYKIYQLFKKIHTRFPYKIFIILSLVIMIIGILTPFNVRHPILANIHTYFCLASCILYILFEIICFTHMKLQYHEAYNYFAGYYFKLLVLLCTLFIVFGRINGYIEILFFITITLPLYLLEKHDFL